MDWARPSLLPPQAYCDLLGGQPGACARHRLQTRDPTMPGQGGRWPGGGWWLAGAPGTTGRSTYRRCHVVCALHDPSKKTNSRPSINWTYIRSSLPTSLPWPQRPRSTEPKTLSRVHGNLCGEPGIAISLPSLACMHASSEPLASHLRDTWNALIDIARACVTTADAVLQADGKLGASLRRRGWADVPLCMASCVQYRLRMRSRALPLGITTSPRACSRMSRARPWPWHSPALQIVIIPASGGDFVCCVRGVKKREIRRGGRAYETLAKLVRTTADLSSPSTSRRRLRPSQILGHPSAENYRRLSSQAVMKYIC